MRDAKGRKVAILGDMGELGENEEQMHAEVGYHAAKNKIDLLICTGKISDHMAEATMASGGCGEVFAGSDDGGTADLSAVSDPERGYRAGKGIAFHAF